MTLLGKILVFLTVVLSFLMLAWAAALYTNRIDWSNQKATADHPAGVLAAREERVKDGTTAVNLANARGREAMRGNDGKDKRAVRVGLLDWEKRRAESAIFYKGILQMSETGPEGKQDNSAPIKRVATKDGQPVIDPKNPALPQLVDAERRKTAEEGRGQPLYCFKWYEKELGRLTDEILKAEVEQQKLAKEEETLSDQIIGPKGARQRIADEQVKLGRVQEELKDVRDRQTNSLVDTELLLQRRGQLERRINELGKASKVQD